MADRSSWPIRASPAKSCSAEGWWSWAGVGSFAVFGGERERGPGVNHPGGPGFDGVILGSRRGACRVLGGPFLSGL